MVVVEEEKVMEVVITGQDKIADDGWRCCCYVDVTGQGGTLKVMTGRTATIERGVAEVIARGRTRVVRPEARQGKVR